MFHGVSSFRRLHTAILDVLQSGAYANSPIFHQPCDTTDFVGLLDSFELWFNIVTP
jgi:alkyl sulfatase BDS1-like metallo-beta-lactamase superfamily hydrolase